MKVIKQVAVRFGRFKEPVLFFTNVQVNPLNVQFKES